MEPNRNKSHQKSEDKHVWTVLFFRFNCFLFQNVLGVIGFDLRFLPKQQVFPTRFEVFGRHFEGSAFRKLLLGRHLDTDVAKNDDAALMSRREKSLVENGDVWCFYMRFFNCLLLMF